jgi:hypothetical protein
MAVCVRGLGVIKGVNSNTEVQWGPGSQGHRGEKRSVESNYSLALTESQEGRLHSGPSWQVQGPPWGLSDRESDEPKFKPSMGKWGYGDRAGQDQRMEN